MIIEETNPNKTKQLIKNSQDASPLLVKSQDHSFNRSVLEYGKFTSLLFPNLSIKGIRKIKLIDSHLDRVSAKAAAKNNISITYDLSKIRSLPKKQKAIEIEKLRKNIRLCKKHKAQFKLESYKEKTSASDLLQSLSASSQQAKKAISF